MSLLATPRLLLRDWRTSDLEPFAALNADPQTMEFMAGCLSREASDAFAAWAQSELGRRGWGVWAVELQATDGLGRHVIRRSNLSDTACILTPPTPTCAPPQA